MVAWDDVQDYPCRALNRGFFLLMRYSRPLRRTTWLFLSCFFAELNELLTFTACSFWLTSQRPHGCGGGRFLLVIYLILCINNTPIGMKMQGGTVTPAGNQGVAEMTQL